MIFLVGLSRCAPSVAASKSLEPSSLPCLDAQGQRELIAGCERIVGKERAKAAACCARVTDAENRKWEHFAWGLLGGSAATALVTIVAVILEGTYGRK